MADKSSSLATLAASIRTGVDNRLKDLHTAMPGIVESFDPVKQLASVQPAIKRIFKQVDADTEFLVPTDLPILINVPVIFPRGGGFSLTFPVKQGDECLLTFCERGIDRWHQFGGVQEPVGRRFHALSDATAFVGLSSLNNKTPNYATDGVELKKDDGSVSIKLTDSGDANVHCDGDLNADCVNATIAASTTANITSPIINLNGAVNISGLCTMSGGMAVVGSATANSKDIGDTHGHAQDNDSNNDTQANISGVV